MAVATFKAGDSLVDMRTDSGCQPKPVESYPTFEAAVRRICICLAVHQFKRPSVKLLAHRTLLDRVDRSERPVRRHSDFIFVGILLVSIARVSVVEALSPRSLAPFSISFCMYFIGFDDLYDMKQKARKKYRQ